MSDPYEGLSLDKVLELATADYENVGGLDEQAMSSRMFTSQVQDSIAQFEHALRAIGSSMTSQTDALPPSTDPDGQAIRAVMTAFSGMTAEAALHQTMALTDSTADGGDRMDPQSRVIEDISGSVRDNYYALSELGYERDSLLELVADHPEHPELAERYPHAGSDPAALTRAINEDFDEQGRARMRSATEGYYALASTLPEVKPYRGPRMPAPESTMGGDQPYGDLLMHRPGRQFDPNVSTAVDTSSGGGAPLPAGPPNSNGPELQAGGVPHGGAPMSAPLATPMPVPSNGSVFVPNGPVVPPVIGGRTGLPPSFRPSGGGLPSGNRGGGPVERLGGGSRPVTRPVIGQRGVPGQEGPGQGTRGLPGQGTRGMSGQGSRGVPGQGTRGLPGQGTRGMSGQGTRGVPGQGTRGLSGQGTRGLPGQGRGAGGRAVPPRGGLPGRGSSGARQSGLRSTGGRDAIGGSRTPRGFGANRAGVRTPSTTDPAANRSQPGRVIGRRSAPVEPTIRGAGRTTRAVRVPRIVHGGNETVNRPVIGSRSESARLAAARAAFRRGEEEPEKLIVSEVEEETEWIDLRGTVRPVITARRQEDAEHDPGNFLTRFNLGRDR